MSPDPVRVLVLYSHPLMGEGLERMLAAETGVEVHAVDIALPAAVDAALAREPAVIVVDAADIVRRSSCAVVMDVDITTTRAWTLRRESLSSRPDDFLNEIRTVVRSVAKDDPGPSADVRPEADPGPGTQRVLQPVIVPG